MALLLHVHTQVWRPGEIRPWLALPMTGHVQTDNRPDGSDPQRRPGVRAAPCLGSIIRTSRSQAVGGYCSIVAQAGQAVVS